MCSVKNCSNSADITFSYVYKGKIKFHNRCKEHKLDSKSIDLTKQATKNFSYGPTCPSCKGKGILLKFTHIRNGLCFRCDGKGHN